MSSEGGIQKHKQIGGTNSVHCTLNVTMLSCSLFFVVKLLSKKKKTEKKRAETAHSSSRKYIQKHFHFCIDFFWLAQSRLETTKTLSFLKFCGMNGFCVFIAYSY